MAEIFGVDEMYANNVAIDELESERQTLIGLLLDASGSMNVYEQVMRGCLQTFQGTIKNSKESDEILVAKTEFASDIIPGGYQLIDDMNVNYNAYGCTKLYDCIVDAQRRLIDGNGGGYMEKLQANGIKTKAVITILSDGQDNASDSSLNEARRAIEFLHKNEVIVVFVAFGFDAHGIADKLGIYKQNVLKVDSTESELRKVFMLISKSAISASKTVGTTNNADDSFFVV